MQIEIALSESEIARAVNLFLRQQGFDSSETDVQFLVSVNEEEKKHIINASVKATKKGV